MHASGHCTYIRTKYSVAPERTGKWDDGEEKKRLRNKTIAYKWALGIFFVVVCNRKYAQPAFLYAHSVVFRLRALVRLFGIIQFPEIYIGHFHHKIGAFDLISIALVGSTVCVKMNFHSDCIFRAESIASFINWNWNRSARRQLIPDVPYNTLNK